METHVALSPVSVVHVAGDLAYPGYVVVADCAQTATGWWEPASGGDSASPVEVKHGRNCICSVCRKKHDSPFLQGGGLLESFEIPWLL